MRHAGYAGVLRVAQNGGAHFLGPTQPLQLADYNSLLWNETQAVEPHHHRNQPWPGREARPVPRGPVRETMFRLVIELDGEGYQREG